MENVSETGRQRAEGRGVRRTGGGGGGGGTGGEETEEREID